jgi:hypothetical protein
MNTVSRVLLTIIVMEEAEVGRRVQITFAEGCDFFHDFI